MNTTGSAMRLLAHQGGWDEALLVAAPVVLFAGIVWNAKRRATRRPADPDATPSEGEG